MSDPTDSDEQESKTLPNPVGPYLLRLMGFFLDPKCLGPKNF